MPNIPALRAANARRWQAMHVHQAAVKSIDKVARRLVDPEAKKRYVAISQRTKVPWPFIAVTHERESSQNWSRSLAQGDPWNQRSTHVPAGRGPFKSFEDAAYDALVTLKHFDQETDWTIGAFLTRLEQYNGFGYASKGVPSPYIWAQTDQYKSGKYIRDHVYDPNVVDPQMGCAALLARMMVLDPSIHIDGASSVHEEHPAVSEGSKKLPTQAPATQPAQVPTTAAPKPQAPKEDAKATGIAAGFLALLAALWAFARDHLPEIAIGLAVLIVVGLVAYRLVKKRWPWTSQVSTGEALPALLPHLHLSSGLFSGLSSAEPLSQDLGQELAAASEALQAVQSQPSSASKQRRKRSAKPLPKTRTRRKSSNSSSRTAATKSSPKRKSKSKGSRRKSNTTR